MKISTKGRYALRVMVDLAAHADESEYIRLKDISQRQGITLKYLEQIDVYKRQKYTQCITKMHIWIIRKLFLLKDAQNAAPGSSVLHFPA